LVQSHTRETVWFYEEMKKQGSRVRGGSRGVEGMAAPWSVPGLRGSEKFMGVWNEKLRGVIKSAA
jgi:hypothetical protein